MKETSITPASGETEGARKKGSAEISWVERNGGVVFGVAVFGALALITLLMWLFG